MALQSSSKCLAPRRDLLGRPLEILVAVLALGFPAATVWFWRRVRGHRTMQVAQRAGLLVGSQLAAVMATAVAFNHIGYFYGSWSDLLRGQLTGVRITAVPMHGARASRKDIFPASAGHLTVRTPQTPTGSLLKWAHDGRLESVTIRGAASALAVGADLYFPPQYFQPAYSHTRFPAVEVLAPSSGNTASSYLSRVRRSMGGHRFRPPVLVVVHLPHSVPREAQCVDQPVGPLWETLYAIDVPSQIAHVYRVAPNWWGVAGEDAGGYCAVKLAMVHPRVFIAAAAIDAFFAPRAPSGSTDPWGGSKALRDLSDMNWRLEHMPPPPVSLLLISTRPSTSATSAALAKRTGPPMAVHRIDNPVGGTPANLTSAIAWLAQELPPNRVHS